jgi:hypothetical protein
MNEHGICASCRWWTPWDERGYYADYGTCYLRPPAVTGNERRGNRDLAPTVSARGAENTTRGGAMGDLHVFTGEGSLPHGDPAEGKTPRPFMVKHDGRCAMPYRVYEGRFDYDQTTTWEVGRFYSHDDAVLFLAAVGGREVERGARFFRDERGVE